MIQFKEDFKIYSIGIELSYWENVGDAFETNRGVDIGVEMFRNMESVISSKKRKPSNSKFTNNFRIYSEFEIGQVWYGLSSGPFIELNLNFFENRYNFGIQSTIWANPIIGLDFRPTFSLEGFGYSYGTYFKVPGCTGYCL
jgi:hypothetical protein